MKSSSSLVELSLYQSEELSARRVISYQASTLDEKAAAYYWYQNGVGDYPYEPKREI